jgi:uncharacterized membrane protein
MIFLDSILKIVKGFSALSGGSFFFYVGVLHFTDTSWFEPIVPPIFGSARFWVLLSGFAEILVGLGLIISGFEIFFSSGNYFCRKAGLASALLLVMLYPANLYMWIYDIELGDGASLSPTGHIVRLLLQIGGIIISIWIAGFGHSFTESSE